MYTYNTSILNIGINPEEPEIATSTKVTTLGIKQSTLP
jgi:hypothetical protein